jgi:predicted lipoprotein with Yx(FWY)xxD motif
MKRLTIPIAAILVAGVAAVAAEAAPAPTVRVASTAKGKILESNSGATLYVFSRDPKNKDTCVTISGCSGAWPALTVKRRPVAGTGVKSAMLGTIKVGAKTQVTYAGHALYMFGAEPKGTGYVGFKEFGGNWDAITAAGKIVK